MREHLDRHTRDPNRRRARLARLAQDLLRKRDGTAMGAWLVQQLREVVGAHACTLWRRDGVWTAWYTAGDSRRPPDPETLSKLASGPAPAATLNGRDLLLAIP